jgi:ParB family transcriptional regulator, chromosome partitioning protein
MARKAPELTTYFSSARQSQQLSEAEQEIQRLKDEIEKLRRSGSVDIEERLQVLRSEISSHTGILSVAIEQIFSNPSQPRQTFLPQSIDSIGRSLEKDGQLEPIILIEIELGKFLIFDGERRWRGAKALGWTHLQAVIIPEPISLHRKALLTSLHREDLNPLDKAEAIIKEIVENTNLDSRDIPRLLSTAIRRLNKQKKLDSAIELITTPNSEQQDVSSFDLNEQELEIFRLLLDLQLNPASVDANIFPMLSLADDLKVAIRNMGLKGVQAMSLQTLNQKNLGISQKKASSVRVKTTEKVIIEKLSASQTRQLVASVRAEFVCLNKENSLSIQPITRITNSLQKLQTETLEKVNISQLKEVQSLLNQKLTEIETVIKKREQETSS